MMDRLQIPTDLREKIDRELGPGEVIHWIDQPIVRFFTPVAIGYLTVGIVGMSIILLGVFVKSIDMAKRGSEFELFLELVFMSAFSLIPFSFLSIPFTTKKATQKTVYIITDRRAISFEGYSPMTIRSYLPNQLQNVYRQEDKNGSGNVMITIRSVQNSEDGERKESIGFMNIRDPRGAEKFLRELADINI